jgi:hypothetical protein
VSVIWQFWMLERVQQMNGQRGRAVVCSHQLRYIGHDFGGVPLSRCVYIHHPVAGLES